MPRHYLTKFDDGGKKCKYDIDYLRKHHECGLPFIQDRPFNPQNPIPPHKFSQINRDFPIDKMDKQIPRVPTHVEPSAPIPRRRIKGDIEIDPYTFYLPQDNTNEFIVRAVGKRGLAMDDRGLYTRIGNDAYAHQDLIPSFEEEQAIGAVRQPYNVGGDVPLEDFGAGTGINLGTDFQALPRGDPRSAEEFATMESINELMERSEESLIRTNRILGRPGDVELEEIPRPRGINQQDLELQELQHLTRNETPAQAERIRRVMFRDLPEEVPERGRPRLRQSRLPPPDAPPSPPEEEQRPQRPQRRSRRPQPQEEGTELFVIDPEAEERLIIEEAEKFIRRGRTSISKNEAEAIIKKYTKKGMTQKRIYEILEEFNLYDRVFEEQLAQITEPNERALMRRMRAMRIIHEDTNLTPERFVDIDIEPQTPMLSREPGMGRSRIQKQIQRRAGQLPEELRQGFKTATRSAEQFSEAISARSAEALQSIRATSTRIFGRQYSQFRQGEFPTEIDSARNVMGVDMDFTPRTEDITGLRVGDIALAEGIAPLEEGVIARTGRPSITFSENLAGFRRGVFSAETGVGTAGGLAGVGVGLGVGMLTNEAMEKLGIHQNLATASFSGGVAGSAGGVATRIVSMGTASALEKAGITTAAETFAQASARGLAGSLARGAAEGGVIGVVLTPIDMIFNNILYSSIHSHAASNVISTGTIGVAATGLAAWLAGATTAVEATSAVSAPETAGLSLIPGAIATGVLTTIGFFTGQAQDKKEAEARKTVENIKKTSFSRTELIKSLPNYDYDINKAINNFPNKADLGIDDDSWSSYITNLNNIFSDKPQPTITDEPKDEPKASSAIGSTRGGTGLSAGLAGGVAEQHGEKIHDSDQEKINTLFGQQITHYTIKEICKSGSCSAELKAKDKGALNKKEYDWLNEKMAGTLMEQENLQIQLNIQTLQYTQKRIHNAQTAMLDSWNNNQEIITDPNTLTFAYLDTTWKERFDEYAKLDAQRRVIRAYQDNQTTFNNMPKNIRTMANLDPDFESTIQKYYSDMATTAREMNITIPQLVQLQGTPRENQSRVYQSMQFDVIKQDTDVVSDAKRIALEEDAVRNGAINFYDIDQAYLLSDPTNLTTWKPSDAQILQAYNAGMTLREYVDYMHELAKGEDGDFSRLPVYTQEQIKQFTDDDIAHFQDELKMTGHEGLYTWDEQNRTWILHHQNNTLSTNHYSSPYIPSRLLKARQEYADMIHGLNEENQKSVDAFNNNLLRDLSVYGRHYDSIVADVNNERLRAGRVDLLYYDVGKIYNKNRIEFTPMSDVMDTTTKKPTFTTQAETSGRQLQQEQQQSIKEKYGLTEQQYGDVKRDIESKNIRSPDTQQLEQAIQEVKSSPADSPPMAS